MDRSEFQKILKEINVELTDNQCDQFDKYYEILVEWNKVMNLTGITQYDEVLVKHFVDSLAVFKAVCELSGTDNDIKNKINYFKNVSVIDVGTGSGILMIAADRLGASEIYGTDIDELAVESAKENLELNKISEEKAKVYKGDLISVVENKKFDVVVANILADVLLILLHDISKVVKPNGKIIFSGIIEDKCELLKREVESLGFTVEDKS